MKERELAGEFSHSDLNKLTKRLHACAKEVYEHESYIIDMIFSEGDIEGINKDDLKTFVKSRLNLCLSNLKIATIFEVGENPIAEWFYDNINALKFHDFFTGTGSEYNRDWDESRLKWKVKA